MRSGTRPFWTLVGIRAAFLLGTAATLLWAPRTGELVPNGAWDPFSDLVFGTFDQWDARWFLHIARDGYNTTSAAFFPLYPALLALLGSSLVLGTLLSLVAAGLGALCVAEIVRPTLGDPTAEISDDEVAARLLALPGIGPYGTAHMMMLLGRHSRLVLDSWTRPKYARVRGRKATDAQIERRFRRYGRYAGLAFWLYLTRDWVADA